MTFAETDTGRRYASIVTPKVQAVARNQFDCQTLEGAQLENQPTRSDSCTGDHWDESVYYPESMSGVISPTTNVLSSLTLALMEDSGWYKADYAMSRMSTWGLGAGCDFVGKPCLEKTADGSVIPDYSKGYFCNKQNSEGCSSELTHKQGCTVIDYQYLVPQNLPPDEFQWFPDEPTKGGPRQADFCPVFGSPTNNKATEKLECSNQNNGDTLRVFR
jgi:leishmanolysin-like peptidase